MSKNKEKKMETLQPKTNICDVLRHPEFTIGVDKSIAADESSNYYIKEAGSAVYKPIDLKDAVKRIKGVTE